MGGFRDGYRDGYREEPALLSDPSSSEEDDPGRKPPFPAEHKLARTRLEKARRTADEVAEAAALLEMGEVKLRSAKFQRALRRAEDAEALFPQFAEKAEAVRLMVKVHLAEENALKAHKLLELKMVAHRTPRSPKAIAVLTLCRADVALALGRPEYALRQAQAAVEAFHNLGEEAWEALANRTVARVSLKMAKMRSYKRAQPAAEAALRYFKNVGDVAEEAVTLLLVSEVHMAKGEYEDAHLFAKSAAEISRARGAGSREAAALQQLARVLLAQNGDPEQAVSLAKQAATKCRNNGDALGQIAAHQVVASAHQAEGLVNMALEALNEALVLARKIGHRHLITTLLDAIVKIYDPEGALGVLREEEDLARRSGDVKREVKAMCRIANHQLEMGQFEEASRTAEEVVQFSRSARDLPCQAEGMKLAGEVSKRIGNMEEALDGLLHARSLMEEADDVPGQLAVLESIQQIHEGQSDHKAQQVLEQRKKLYHEAAWKEQEARTLLEMAGLLLRNRGTIRAVEKAREAIQLFGLEDDECKALTAEAYLELASIMEGNIRYVREGPGSIRTARELFKEIGDAVGQCRALDQLAELHLKRDDDKEAEKLYREAMDVCRNLGDTDAEAEAAMKLVNFHMDRMSRATQNNGFMDPPKTMLQDAANDALKAVHLYRGIGKVTEQINLLLLLAGLHCDLDEGESAEAYAEEALQLSVREQNRVLEAYALLSVATAHLSLGEAEEGLKCALGARELFEQMGDEDGVDKATTTVQQAKQCPKERKPRKPKTNSESSPSHARVQDEVGLRSTGRSRDKGRAFSAMLDSMKVEEEKQRRREELLEKKARDNVPPQEQRRRQLLEASQENRSQGEIALEEEPQELQLSDVLHCAKPEWENKDIQKVLEKFGQIDINSPQDLYETLHTEGPAGINKRLKQVKQKPMKSETLDRLLMTLEEICQGQGVG